MDALISSRYSYMPPPSKSLTPCIHLTPFNVAPLLLVSVLIFSQFKIMLDVLEDYVHLCGWPVERIDGSITGRDRQAAIDRYSSGKRRQNAHLIYTTRPLPLPCSHANSACSRLRIPPPFPLQALLRTALCSSFPRVLVARASPSQWPIRASFTTRTGTQ